MAPGHWAGKSFVGIVLLQIQPDLAAGLIPGGLTFEMSVTHGRSRVFPVSEVLLRSVDDTVGKLERRPLAAQRVDATTWRCMLSPGGGYYLRSLANFNPGFPESASLAILKSLDFPELVQSVLGSKK
jgi:hypothetical protein